MLAPGRPSTNRLRARENAVRASSWRCTSASVGSASARRISSEKAGALAPHLPEAGVGVQLHDPPLGPFQQVAQRLHPRHQPRVEDQRRACPRGSFLSPVRSPAVAFPGRRARRLGLGTGGVGGDGWWDGAGADVVGEGPVRQEGGAAEGAQLAGVEAAEGGGEEGGEELVGPGRVEGEAEQVQHVPDDRLGHELALARTQPVRDAEPLEGPAGGPAEPPGRRQQDGHPAVGDAVPFVGDPQEAGVRLGLLGGAGVAGGLHGGGPTPGEGDDRTGPGRLEAAHGVEPGAAEPPAALEQHDAGAEAAGPGRQRAGDGAAEGVGGAGRVAGQDGPGPAAGQQREQPELGGVELLGLVDQDRPDLGDRGGEDVGTVLEQVAGLEDEAGLVDRVLQGEVLAIEGEEGRDRDPVGAAGGPGPLEQLLGVDDAALAGEHELGQLVGEGAGVDERRQRAPVDLRLVEGEQRPHQRPLFGAAQRARLAAVVEQVGVAGDQGAGERVPGHAAQLAAGGPGEAGHEPFGRGHRGLAAGGQEPGRAAGRGQQVVHARLQQRRLPAARAAEDDHVAGREHGGQLGRRAVGEGHRPRARKRAGDRPRRRRAGGGRVGGPAARRLVRGGYAWPVHDAGILASGYDAGWALSTAPGVAGAAARPGDRLWMDGTWWSGSAPMLRLRCGVRRGRRRGSREADDVEEYADQGTVTGRTPAGWSLSSGCSWLALVVAGCEGVVEDIGGGGAGRAPADLATTGRRSGRPGPTRRRTP